MVDYDEVRLKEELALCLKVERWIKFKRLNDHSIVICCFTSHIENRIKIITGAYMFTIELAWAMVHLETVDYTIKLFNKKDKKIAKWYFKQLCKYFQYGILTREHINYKKSDWGRKYE